MKADEKVLKRFCHRKPDYSFVAGGVKSFFCQRCTGIYLGFLFGIFFMLFTNSFHINRLELGIVVFLIPLFYDVLTQGFGLRKSKNMFRITTGMMFGFGIAPIMGLSEFGVEFPFMAYLIFVLLLTVIMMFMSKRFGSTSVTFVRAVSWVSVISIMIMWVVVPMLMVRFFIFIGKLILLGL